MCSVPPFVVHTHTFKSLGLACLLFVTSLTCWARAEGPDATFDVDVTL